MDCIWDPGNIEVNQAQPCLWSNHRPMGEPITHSLVPHRSGTVANVTGTAKALRPAPLIPCVYTFQRNMNMVSGLERWVGHQPGRDGGEEALLGSRTGQMPSQGVHDTFRAQNVWERGTRSSRGQGRGIVRDEAKDSSTLNAPPRTWSLILRVLGSHTCIWAGEQHDLDFIERARLHQYRQWIVGEGVYVEKDL